MAGSLADQLLNMGVASKKQAKDARDAKRKTKKAKKSGKAPADDQKVQDKLEQQRKEKQQRDRELNLKREAEKEEKSRIAQLQKILEDSLIKLDPKADEAYNFVEAGKIKKIYVTKPQLEQLSRCQLAIAVHQDLHWLIPDEVAARLEADLGDKVVRIKKETVDEDDPYADYQVPDDLMW